MPTIDFGKVQGDNGTSMRSRGAWTPSTEYKNDLQYIDIITNGGSSYSCKTTHTSGTTFSNENWNLIAQKGDKGNKGDKGDNGITPIIKAGTATSLNATAAPTVSATTSGNTTTLNFGIPKGDISEIKTPTFDDSVGTYTTLNAANTAAETASNAIKTKVNIFTILSNMKKSFSAIIQGLKILATNVGAINGITDSLTSTSSNIAASAAAIKALNDKTTELNGNIANKLKVVTILNVSTRNVGAEYTANNKANNFTYFIPILTWRRGAVVAKQDYDSTYDIVTADIPLVDSSICVIRHATFLINKTTGAVKIEKLNQANLQSDGNFIFSANSMDVGLLGISW